MTAGTEAFRTASEKEYCGALEIWSREKSDSFCDTSVGYNVKTWILNFFLLSLGQD